MKIEVTIDYAPKSNDSSFDEWCEKYGFYPLNSGHRAWCRRFNTFFRDALGVATTPSGKSFLIYKEDLEKKA